MSLKPTHRSDIKEQQGSSYAGAVTGGALSVEEGTLQDEVEVKGGSHIDVQEDAGRDLGPMKGDDWNRGKDLKLTTEVFQQFGGELESTNMVSDPDILPDGSAFHVDQEQEQATKNKTVGEEILSDMEEISARDLNQKLVVVDSKDLPEEVVLILFKFMKPGDIFSASQTCHLWRIVGENDNLWQQKCREAGLAFTLTPANKKAVEQCNESSSIAYSAWKESFLKPYKTQKKLREGVLQVITVETNHGVNRMELFNDKIVTSFGTNLYVFCASRGKLLHELVGHTSYVAGFQMDDQFIVSGSHDGSVKVWDVDTGSCLQTLLDHTGGVAFLQFHGNIAVSGSFDTNTLRVLDVQEGVCLRILTHHNILVYSNRGRGGNGMGRGALRGRVMLGRVGHVQFDGRFVVSGSDDNMIKIWDVATGECLRTLHHNSNIVFLKLNGVDVVAGYADGSIKVWEVNTGVCRRTLRTNFSQYMEFQGDTLVCVGDDRIAQIWNMSTGDFLHTLGEHRRAITGIGVNGKLVVTSSRDGTVKLWDVKTGEFIRDLLVLESGGSVEKMKMEDAKIVCVVKSNQRLKLLVLKLNDSD